MSGYSRLIREYIRASEALLKADELTFEEKKLIDEMLTRISTEVLRGYLPVDGNDVDANRPASDLP